MARLTNRKSRRSPESVYSKIVFDDEEPPIILGGPILLDDDWAVVNQKLKDSDWNQSYGYGLISLLYKKPGICEIKEKHSNVDYFTEEDHVKEYAIAKYGWLDKADTMYDDNASIDDNSVSNSPDITTSKSILSNQQTTILPNYVMSSIVTTVETNISQSSQHQKHPKKWL